MKAVKTVTNAVTLPNGESVAMASDGQIYHVSMSTPKGTVMDKVMDNQYEVAVTKSGVAAIKKAIPHLIVAAKARQALYNLEQSAQAGGLGGLAFIEYNEDENSDLDLLEFGIGVGCTFVNVSKLPKVLKALGLK